MATNRIALKTIIEFMQGYVPVYQPVYPLFLGKSQSYSEEVGKIEFKRVNTVGDIRAKHVTPKDTEIRQIAANEASKIFKKYFLANQFTMSDLQDNQAVEDVISQVLDEHHKQADELFLLGEGTSPSTMINNGLYWSNDPNYNLNPNSPPTISTPGGLHTEVMKDVVIADLVAGRKALIFYGVNTLAKFDSLYETPAVPFKRVLGEVLGNNYNVSKLPLSITPAAAEGWMIVNLDQVKLHYTALPALKAQGINDEKMYAWFNFLMGSSMLEVLALNGVIRQDATVS